MVFFAVRVLDHPKPVASILPLVLVPAE
jgi:hypothetical protein